MEKLELFSCLKYTPFDNKVSSIFYNGANAEEQFFNHLFEPYNEGYYNKIRQNLDSAIQNTDSRFIYFVGPSGTGKTTFLHYYFRTLPKDSNVSYNFINLVKYPSTSIEEDALKRSLCNYIDSVLDETTINQFLDAHTKSRTHMPTLVENDENGDKRLLDFLFKRKYEKKLNALVCLLGYYNPIQLASVLVILSIYKQGSPQRQNVFVFDNIDELSSTYIGKYFVDFILNVFSIVQEYFNIVDPDFFSFKSPFINHCTFLVALRAINAKLIGEKQQFNERVRLQNAKVEFNPHIYSYSKMLKKRIDYYVHSDHKPLETDAMLAFRRYSQIVAEENFYIESRIEPLMNFDRRILTLSFNNIIENSSWFSGLDSLPEGIGRRGAVILNTLDFLYKENNNSSLFSTYVLNDIKSTKANEMQKCNIHRMCFTLLSNLSGIGYIEKKERPNVLNDEIEFFEHLNSVRLDGFMDRLKNWYSDDDIKNVLTTLVSISSSNYEVPVFFEGSVVDEFTNEYFKSNVMNLSTPSYVHALVDYVTNMSNAARQNVLIKINPLCVIYPYHIFIHFEYFNLLSYNNQNKSMNQTYDLKSLFLIAEKRELSVCLDRVWSVFNKMVTSMQYHFCYGCSEKCQDKRVNNSVCAKQVAGFKNAQVCFNGALYSTRAISSIINYLDSYRVFMWRKTGFDKEIQNILIEEIKKYIEMYQDKKVQDDSAQEKIAMIKLNLREIEEKGEYWRYCKLDSDFLGVN